MKTSSPRFRSFDFDLIGCVGARIDLLHMYTYTIYHIPYTIYNIQTPTDGGARRVEIFARRLTGKTEMETEMETDGFPPVKRRELDD